MAKIPFTLEAWLKDTSQKVELKNGNRVRILAWDLPGDFPIAAADWPKDDEIDTSVEVYDENGWDGIGEKKSKLFIVTPEPELTEFENAFGRAMMEVPEPEEKEEWYPFLKEKAAELLDLAKKESLNDFPRWKKIKEVTTKRTEDGDCVTTEALLVKGWRNSDDYIIIEPNCMVNQEMLCIPVRLLYKLPGFKED